MNLYFVNFYEKNFKYRRKEKLSKFTIIFIMFLNIFILLSLFFSFELQHRIVSKPNTLFPNICRSVVLETNITNFNNYFYTYVTNNDSILNIQKDKLDEKCSILINEKLANIQREHDVKSLREKEKILVSKQKQIIKELNFIRENYYTVLYGELSNEPIAKYIIIDNIPLNAIKEKHDNLTVLNDEILKKKRSLNLGFDNSQSVQSLLSYIYINKNKILNEYTHLKNYYKLKKDLISLGILLPFIFLCFRSMKKFRREGKFIYFLISKNILYILLIPTIIFFIFLCSDLLPQNLINRILEFNFPFFIYYILLFFIIVLFGSITIHLQNKYRDDIKNFKKESISRIDSYYKNICNVCVTPIDYNSMDSCPTCNNQLKIDCKHCNCETIKDLSYCIHCGEHIKDEQFFTIKDF